MPAHPTSAIPTAEPVPPPPGGVLVGLTQFIEIDGELKTPGDDVQVTAHRAAELVRSGYAILLDDP